MTAIILETARRDPNVRAAVMNGSRVSPRVSPDIWQDYDVVYYVENVRRFKEEIDLVRTFGELMILQTPDDMGDPPPPSRDSYAYLMQFTDGNRIDLTVAPVDQIGEVGEDSLTRVLIDKDNRIPELPAPSEESYRIREPSEKDFVDACNEFWWVVPYAAKGIWRDELTYAKFALESLLRTQLLKMLGWYIGIGTGFREGIGKQGKKLKDCLSAELYEMLRSTYSDARPAHMWASLAAMEELFRTTGKSVAEHFGYPYPEREDRLVSEFARPVRTRGEGAPAVSSSPHRVDIGDTRLHVVERGEGYPLIVLHGGPGLDHHMFGDYLDALTDEFRLILVDQRSQGLSDHCPQEKWTLRQMAADVRALAVALGLDAYAVLGHSYGAFVALQNAVDFPGAAAQTIVSSGLPSARYLQAVWRNLEVFEPEELREQVRSSWEREKVAQTREQVDALLHDQLPFQFENPLDPRIAEYEKRSAGGVNSPDVLRFFANAEYGGIEVEDRLGLATHPILVLAGRADRTCAAEGAEAMAKGLPDAQLVVFENSAHMTFVEENGQYLARVREFLNSHR